MTRRASTGAILAEIEGLEKILSAQEVEDAQDRELEQEADSIADEERAIAEESTDVPVKDEGDQNEKSMDNWPLTSAERERIARRLVVMAKVLMRD